MRPPRLSTSNWFVKALVLCYERPGEALERMEKFSAHRGQGALLKKLAAQPGYFGRCSFTARVVRGSIVHRIAERSQKCRRLAAAARVGGDRGKSAGGEVEPSDPVSRQQAQDEFAPRASGTGALGVNCVVCTVLCRNESL